jgi:AcrR family transcriptional regulator
VSWRSLERAGSVWYNAVRELERCVMQLQPAEKRRRQQRNDARRAILNATESLLVENGYDGFSMRRLADRCGYTAPTIYHYFGDKRGLIDALLEERFRKLLSRLRRVRLGDDAVENLAELARAFVRFGARNQTHYRLLHAPRSARSSPPPSAEAARALFEAPFQQLAEQGRLLTDDVEAATQACWATLHGLISLRTSRPDYPWSSDLVETAIGTLVRGLVAPGASSAREVRA